MDSLYNNVKAWNHCHVTVKYGRSAHRDCNIKLKLNRKIPIAFHNLKSYDARLIM